MRSCGALQIFTFLDTVSPSHTTDKKSDFYKDSNVAEVKASLEILQNLKIQVDKLLNEWPEHPTLLTVFFSLQHTHRKQ